MLVYGVLVVLGVVLMTVTTVRILVGGLDRGRGRPSTPARVSGDSARQVLDERYAAGQLSTEEYQHRVRVLEESKS